MYQTACDAIDKAATDLHKLSDIIWKNPELGYEEHQAHKALTDFLEVHGFSVHRNYLLDTAFRSDYGTGKTVFTAYFLLIENSLTCGKLYDS